MTSDREPRGAVCLMSGGLDSAVTAAVAIRGGFIPKFLFVDYGQKTRVRERQSAQELATHFGSPELRVVRLPWLRSFGKSGLFRDDVNLDETNFRLEYVPFRNSILLAIATALAEVTDADRVYIGSTGSDRICPDNSPEFIEAFQGVVRLGTMLKTDIQVTAPLVEMDKVGVVKLGSELGVPFEKTWSCHNGKKLACAHCSNCRSRLVAFDRLGLKDPLRYSSSAEEISHART